MALVTIGRYRIERLIKRGGMGVVYLGIDPELRRPIAIKVLRDDLDGDDLRERFRREAIAIAAVRHPNIVTVFHADVDDGRPYIAMEYVPGETLAELVRRDAALPLERKLQIVEDVCGALGAAHLAGIVHRDIKPANILVDLDGTVKVVDFGIARTPDATLTQLGSLVGTLDYMAPEQFTDRDVDGRTDIFAVGVLLYELIANRRPFPGDFQDTLVARVLHRDPVPLADVCPDVDANIAAIVMKALERAPEQRYQKVQLLREALTNARRRVSAGADATLVSPRMPPPAPPASASRRIAAFSWRGAAAASAVGLVLVSALIVGVDRIVGGNDTPLPLVWPPAPPARGATMSPVDLAVVEIPAPPPVRAAAPPTPPVERPRPSPLPPASLAGPRLGPPPGLAAGQGPKPESPAPSVPAPLKSVADTGEPARPEPDPAPPSPSAPAPVAPVVTSQPPLPSATEHQLVREVVERYMQAMSNRDVTAMADVRRLDPKTRAEMAAQFGELRSWKVTFADPFVTVNLDAASAKVTGRFKYEDVRTFDDRRGRVKDQHATIQLRKAAGAWHITEIE